MQNLTQTLLSAAELHSKITGTDISTDLINRLKVWGAGIFRLVVMGEINKGKSSFINALLDTQDLVPVADTVATSTAFKIRYTDKPLYRVHFLRYLNKPAITISAEELSAYGTEAGNPGNEKEVDFIEVGHPSPLLQAGLVVIDTPGLGGIIKSHQRITWQYVPNADAAVFITDSTAPLGYADLEHLRQVRNITPHIFFVQTKSSAVDADAVEARAQNNKSILSKDWGVPTASLNYFIADSALYFAGSGKLKELYTKASGYPAILDYFSKTLLANQHHLLADRAVKSVAPLITEMTQSIQARRANLSADTHEKRQATDAALRQADADLAEWQTYKQAEINQALNFHLQRVRTECIDHCRDLRQFDTLHQNFNAKIENAQNCKELTGVLNDINEQISVTLSEKITKVCDLAQSGVRHIINELATATGISPDDLALNEPDTSIIGKGRICNVAIQRALEYIQNGHNTFEQIRAMLFGAGAGASICSAVGAALGSVVPVIGSIAGSYLGITLTSIWCGKKMLSVTRDNVLNRYQQQAFSAVGQMCSLVHTDLVQNINQMFAEFKEAFSTAISKALRYRQTMLKRQRDEFLQIKQNNAADFRALNADLSRDESALRKLLGTISPWLNNTPTAILPPSL